MAFSEIKILLNIINVNFGQLDSMNKCIDILLTPNF